MQKKLGKKTLTVSFTERLFNRLKQLLHKGRRIFLWGMLFLCIALFSFALGWWLQTRSHQSTQEKAVLRPIDIARVQHIHEKLPPPSHNRQILDTTDSRIAWVTKPDAEKNHPVQDNAGVPPQALHTVPSITQVAVIASCEQATLSDVQAAAARLPGFIALAMPFWLLQDPHLKAYLPKHVTPLLHVEGTAHNKHHVLERFKTNIQGVVCTEVSEKNLFEADGWTACCKAQALPLLYSATLYPLSEKQRFASNTSPYPITYAVETPAQLNALYDILGDHRRTVIFLKGPWMKEEKLIRTLRSFLRTINNSKRRRLVPVNSLWEAATAPRIVP